MKITNKMLSGWIDDGLTPKQMKIVSRAVHSDPELQARADALRSIGISLHKEPPALPITAECMAQNVRREIRLNDTRPSASIPQWVRATVISAACLLILTIVVPQINGVHAAVAQTQVEFVDSTLSGVSPMVYTDFESGWTVIWLDDAELESTI